MDLWCFVIFIIILVLLQTMLLLIAQARWDFYKKKYEVLDAAIRDWNLYKGQDNMSKLDSDLLKKRNSAL